MKNTKIILGVIAILLLAIGGFFVLNTYQRNNNTPGSPASSPTPTTTVSVITNFEECIAAGNPVMESFPRQCRANGKTFVEDTDNAENEAGKADLIVVLTPTSNQTVQSPLIVNGQARGTWYFEADFPVYLYDGNGKRIATGVAQAQGDWMTEEFVPFSATLTFPAPQTPTGYLILEKSNPSGLPENADELRIPVRFGSATTNPSVSPE